LSGVEAEEARQRAHLPPPTPQADTGEVSIWEIFGVKRPSEQDMAVLNDLVKSVQSRKLLARRVEGRIPKRPVPVRRLSVTLGLRMRLALHGARVRLRQPSEQTSEDE
jgi:hypothetical protein